MVIKMYSALSARERQKLFEDLIETSHDLIWQCDHEGRFTYLNPAWESLVGYERDEMLGRTFSDFQSPAMAACKMEEISQIGESDLLRNFRTDFIGRSGETFHFLLNSKPLYHENGHFIGARGTAQNITERVKAESAVRESEERFRSVLDNSLDVIYRLNLQTGRFDYLSPSVERVSSYSRDELMSEGGRNRFSRVHPDDLPGVQAAFEQVERTGIARVDYRLWTKNGTYRWLSNSMVQVSDEAGRPLYREGNIRDIHERKQTEEALRDREQRLRELYEEAKKHAIVKTQLLNEVNHRVKNNLMVILGLILVEKRQSIANGHHEVGTMAEKLEGRIKGLLAVHQMLSNSKWEPINLALLAQSVCRTVLSSGESPEHEIDLRIEPTCTEVTSRQAGSLALIFNELTVNCMKHAFISGGRPSIDIGFGTEGERVRIVFKDNGCGYPESVLKRERWSVGLRLIHQLVEHTLGGSLELLNRNGSVTIIDLAADHNT